MIKFILAAASEAWLKYLRMASYNGSCSAGTAKALGLRWCREPHTFGRVLDIEGMGLVECLHAAVAVQHGLQCLGVL